MPGGARARERSRTARSCRGCAGASAVTHHLGGWASAGARTTRGSSSAGAIGAGGEIETRREGTRAAAGTTRGRGGGRASANASAACAKDRERARVAGVARCGARRGGRRGREERERRTKTAPALESGGAAGDGLLTERHTKSVLAARDRPASPVAECETVPSPNAAGLSASGKFPSPAPAHSPPPLVGTSTRARTSRLASGFSPSPPLGALARPPRHPRVASRSARTMRPPMGGRGGGGRGFGGGRSPGGRGGFGGRGGRGGRGGFDDGPPDTVVGASPARFRLEARFSRARASRTRESRCLLLFVYPSSRAPAPRARFRARSSRRARR